MTTAPVPGREADGPSVFLSYAREDAGFVRRLRNTLGDAGAKVVGDWDLAAGEAYKERLRALILGADAFVFVMSPDSVASSSCGEELTVAVEHHKPVLPVSHRDHGDDARLDSALQSRHWIAAREADDLEGAVHQLVHAARTDLDLTAAHGQLLLDAQEWERSGRRRGYLLRKEGLRSAEEWLGRVSAQPDRLPQPTPQQTAFILASQNDRTRATRIGLGIAVAVILSLSVFAVVAWIQSRVARQQEQIAVASAQEADRQRKAAETARDEVSAQLAENLADRADRQSIPGQDSAQALHLAVRAATLSPPGRPSTALHAARVLHLAVSLPVRMVQLDGVARELVHGVLAADGRHLLAMTRDYTVGLWNVESGQRRPLPFDARLTIGFAGDEVTGGPGEGKQFLEFSRDGKLAKALTGGEQLWVWEVATGTRLGAVRVEDFPDEIAFSRDGRAVIATAQDCGEDEPGRRRPPCCRRTLWAMAGGAPPAAELAEPCDRRRDAGSDESGPRLVYRGRRPVLVRDLRAPDDRSYDGQFEESTGGRWVAFGTTADGKRIIAVSRTGRVSVWDRDVVPLVRERSPAGLAPLLAARSLADGSGLLLLTQDGRLMRQRFDGTEVWSAPLSAPGRHAGIAEGSLWETSVKDAVLVRYRLGRAKSGWAPAWIELWYLGETRPRQTVRLDGGTVADLVLGPSQMDGVVEFPGEDEYNYLHRWSFSGGLEPTMRSVERQLYRGMTRDGQVAFEGDDREMRLLEPVSGRPAVAPITFTEERGIAGTTVAAILGHARGLVATANGIEATLLNGQRMRIERDRSGARVELDGRTVRGSVVEQRPLLSPDGRLLCGIVHYSAGGGRIGASQDLVVREVETGRVLAGHHRLSHGRIVGFTAEGRAVLVQALDGRLFEYFVHDGRGTAPPWYEDLGVSLTGERLLDNLGLASVGAEEYGARRQRLRHGLERSIAEGAEEARFILSHLFSGP